MSHPGLVAACLLVLWGTAALSRQVHPPSVAVGATVCASCHADKYAAWTAGRHSRMLQPAKAATALGDFTQTRLTLHGKPYRLRTANGELYITESSLTGTPVEHHVDYTLGSRRIQHYLTTIDRGRIVVLPPSWDVLRAGMVRQPGHHPSRRARRPAGPAVEQGLRRVPRQPAGQSLRARPHEPMPPRGWISARRASGVMARAARTSRASRRPTSSGRRGWARPRAPWCARSAIRFATPWRPATAPAKTTTTTSCRSSNTRRARNRIRSTGPMAGRDASRTTRSGCGKAAAS